jgi:hypothetical protein
MTGRWRLVSDSDKDVMVKLIISSLANASVKVSVEKTR